MLTLSQACEKYKDFTFRLRAVNRGVVVLVGEDLSAPSANPRIMVELRYDSTHFLNKNVTVCTKPLHPLSTDDTKAFDISIDMIPHPSLINECAVAGVGDIKKVLVYEYKPPITGMFGESGYL